VDGDIRPVVRELEAYFRDTLNAGARVDAGE
jgi:hypothetical protein